MENKKGKLKLLKSLATLLNRLLFNSNKRLESLEDDNSRILSLNKQIKEIKSSTRTPPANLLHDYFFNISELQVIYGNSDLKRSDEEPLPDLKNIDMTFVQELLRYNEIHTNQQTGYVNEYADTLLHQVCKVKSNNSIELIKLLVKNEARTTELNLYGQSLFHVAASFDNVSLVEYLYDTIGELAYSKTFVELQSPLHHAARNGSIGTLRFYGAILGKSFREKLEEKDCQGRTCLYLAAEYGNISVVQMMLESGCDVNITNIYGQSALYWIIAKCERLAFKVLDTFMEQNEYSLHHLELKPIRKSFLLNLFEQIELTFFLHLFFFYI